MTYQTAAAFRRALETRLVAESARTGIPLVRLRKLVVFERFLARLTQAQPGAWLLKGAWSCSCGWANTRTQRRTWMCC